ncbi:putative protease [Lachnospiraceae bacterium G11]|nr:putative protease [Lachnospiraceae bacterium G11]
MRAADLEIYIERYDQFCSLVSDSELFETGLSFKLIIDYNLMTLLKDSELDFLKDKNSFMALPYVLRRTNSKVFDLAQKLESESVIKGILLRNPEEIGHYTGHVSRNLKLISDAGIYSFNDNSISFLSGLVDEITLPIELNKGEKKGLLRSNETMGKEHFSVMVYGRVPMMISANCTYKTSGQCSPKDYFEDYGFLKDRLNNDFPVVRHCDECMNIIYNCVPISLHKDIEAYEGCNLRLCFTIESGKQMKSVIHSYIDLLLGKVSDIASEIEKTTGGYTTGHEKRGVE